MDNTNPLIVSSIRSAALAAGRQGQQFIAAVSGARCGSQTISAGLVVMPPGAMARPHRHDASESVIFIVEGFAATLGGPDLMPVYAGPGDFLYIPPGIPHVAINLSTTQRVVAVEHRTEATFDHDIHLMEGLGARAASKAAALQHRFAHEDLPLHEGWRGLVGHPFDYGADQRHPAHVR